MFKLLLLVVSALAQNDQCAVDNSQKVDCGNKFTSQKSCTNKGCCWEDQGLFSFTPSCFQPVISSNTTDTQTTAAPTTTVDPVTTTLPAKTTKAPQTITPSATTATSSPTATATNADSTAASSGISSGAWVGIGIGAFFVAFGIGTLMYHNISKSKKSAASKIDLAPNGGNGGGSLVPKASPFAAAPEPTPQFAEYTIQRPVTLKPEPPVSAPISAPALAPAPYPTNAYPDPAYPADYYPPTQGYTPSNAGYPTSQAGYPHAQADYYDPNAAGYYNPQYNQQYSGSAVGTGYEAYPQPHVEPQNYHPNYNNTPPPSGYSPNYPQ